MMANGSDQFSYWATNTRKTKSTAKAKILERLEKPAEDQHIHAGEPIGIGPLRPEVQGRNGRAETERDEGRNDDRPGDGQRELLIELARDARQKTGRNENGDHPITMLFQPE